MKILIVIVLIAFRVLGVFGIMGGETGGYSATESNVIGAINEIYRTYRNSYTQFSNDFDNFKQCTINFNLYYPENNINENSTYTDHEEFEKNYTELCEKQQLFFRCIENFTQTLKTYFKKTDFDLLQGVHTATKQFVAYACRNGSFTIIRLRDPKSDQCYVTTNDAINECVQSAKINVQSHSFRQVYENFKSYKCPEYMKSAEKIRECIVNNMATCSELVSNVLDNLLTILYFVFSCEV